MVVMRKATGEEEEMEEEEERNDEEWVYGKWIVIDKVKGHLVAIMRWRNREKMEGKSDGICKVKESLGEDEGVSLRMGLRIV